MLPPPYSNYCSASHDLCMRVTSQGVSSCLTVVTGIPTPLVSLPTITHFVPSLGMYMQ